LAEKYLALWNEPDADRRRRMIAELWTEDGRHILQPPQEVRGIAARPGLAMTALLQARGYEEIEARAASAYRHWVGSEGLSFRPPRTLITYRDALRGLPPPVRLP
jgi:hypothetical protein